MTCFIGCFTYPSCHGTTSSQHLHQHSAGAVALTAAGTKGSSAPCVLQPHLRDHSFNGLSQFFTFHLILSNCFRLQTVRRFSTRTHLSHIFYHFTNTCLPHGKPCSIKSNFISDSSFPCCAWLCCQAVTNMFNTKTLFGMYTSVIWVILDR